MEKRTVIALILIAVVFWISNEYLWKKKAIANPKATQSVNSVRPDTQSDTPKSSEQTESKVSSATNFDSDIPLDENIVLENDRLKIVFSNLGGNVKQVFLKEYFLADKATPVTLIPDGKSLLGIAIQTTQSLDELDGIVFDHSSFTYQDNPGVSFFVTAEDGSKLIEKKYTLNKDYNLGLDFVINDHTPVSDYFLYFDSGVKDSEEFLKNKKRDYKLKVQIDNEVKNFPLAKIKEPEKLTGNISWVGIKSKYFGMILQPDKRLSLSSLSIDATAESAEAVAKITNPSPRANITDHFDIFFGPMLYDTLKDHSIGLESMAEMGAKWLSHLSRFFLLVINLIAKVIPNYGICIIIFAFMLKLVLYPLSHKSFESSHKLQKIQPEIKEIQQKYKKDPQQMNVEMRELYKKHGVSPLGGCLPLLLQMPVFFALYPVLRYSIDLRQAGFLGWIKDLSEPDSLFVLPILMGISMFLQQMLMSPSKQKLAEMDEKQQAAMQSQKMMMYIMPVMMFFIFKSMPSGLVLYWMIFNVFSIIQQYYIRKKFS